MREHTLPELQLAVNQGRLDLHVNTGEVSALTLRILRAMALGGQEPLPGTVYTCKQCGRRSPEDDNGDLRCGHSSPDLSAQPQPQQDEEEMVEDMASVAYETPGPRGQRFYWKSAEANVRSIRLSEARAVLSHLRAHGLLRTQEDARLVTELRQCNDCVGTLRLEHEQLTRANAKLEERCGRAETSAEDWKNRFDQAMATLKDKEARWEAWTAAAQVDKERAKEPSRKTG